RHKPGAALLVAVHPGAVLPALAGADRGSRVAGTPVRRRGPPGRPGGAGRGVRRVAGLLVWITAADQPWAYFDTGARLWEFALGGALALLLTRLDPPRRARVALGWLGLAALVSCGLLLQVSTLFPGYVALWPTLAAAAVIAAGTSGSRLGADRLLTLRPLRYLGSISYAL